MSDKTEVHRVPGGLEFIINEDGSVTFIHIPAEMIDVARALDPDAVLACNVQAEDTGKESSD